MMHLLILTAATANLLPGAASLSPQITPAIIEPNSQVRYIEDSPQKLLRVVAEDGTLYVYDLSNRCQYMVFPNGHTAHRKL